MESVIGTPLDKTIDWDALLLKNKCVMCSRPGKPKKSGKEAVWLKYVEASKGFQPVTMYRSMTSDQLFNKQMDEAVQYFVKKREAIRVEAAKQVAAEEATAAKAKPKAKVNAVTITPAARNSPVTTENITLPARGSTGNDSDSEVTVAPDFCFESMPVRKPHVYGPSANDIFETYTGAGKGYYDAFLGRYVQPEVKLPTSGGGDDASLKKSKFSVEHKLLNASRAFHGVPIDEKKEMERLDSQARKLQLQRQRLYDFKKKRLEQLNRGLNSMPPPPRVVPAPVPTTAPVIMHQQRPPQLVKPLMQPMQQPVQQPMQQPAMQQQALSYNQWVEKQQLINRNIELALKNGRNIIQNMKELPTMGTIPVNMARRF